MSSEFTIQDTEFRLFRDLIYKNCGIVLSDAKKVLVQSRLQKRLRHYQFERFQQYYDLVISMGEDSPELTALINCITTNKTDFFREPHHFEFVGRTVLPEIREANNRGECGRTFRAWHAGCSTGEEPYTHAITLLEALARENWDIKLLASDIDTNVLAHAEAGTYASERIAGIPHSQLKKYFLKGTGEKSDFVRARKELRDLIKFRQINLLDDVWPIRPDVYFDVIFCRNVVIYFDKPTQRTLFHKFAQRLRPGGYLFIGHSESLFGISDDFWPVGDTTYQLKPESARLKSAA
jgi:chemotaxis protein methyltransferase CheR